MLSTGFNPIEIRQKRRLDIIAVASNRLSFCSDQQPQAGVKFFVHDRTFLNLGYRYEFFFNRFEAIDDNKSRGNHVFNLGIGLTWGGAPSTRRP